MVLAEREKALMSGGMGYYDGGLYDADGYEADPQGQAPQREQKNPLREHLNKVETQNEELRKQVQQLVAHQRQNQIADDLQAKGYDRGVAALYGGEPEKLDEWLTSVAPLLAKSPSVTTDQGPGQQGQVPASTVPAEGQAVMQQFQQAGLGAAAPSGSEAEQIAHMNQARSAEELMHFLQSQGNPHFWNG